MHDTPYLVVGIYNSAVHSPHQSGPAMTRNKLAIPIAMSPLLEGGDLARCEDLFRLLEALEPRGGASTTLNPG